MKEVNPNALLKHKLCRVSLTSEPGTLNLGSLNLSIIMIRHSRKITPVPSAQVCLISFLFLFFSIPTAVTADIEFEDVSKSSGIYHLFSTAASAWGDLNNDGWPDLWVSNHWHQPPSVYLNQRNGTFLDVAADVLIGDLRADFHGAAWADFDNDGDQDLLVTTGGGAGRGSCPNYLFVNQGEKLRNEASRLGVDYRYGRGRTPLWFDANQDGKLDLLLMNRSRPGGKAPSAIFLQTVNGFVPNNDKFDFNPSGSRSRLEQLTDLFGNAIRLRWRKGPGQIMIDEEFAQLTNLSGGHHVDLVAYVNPMRVYSASYVPFKEITNDLGFPNKYIGAVRDVAFGDFDGDKQMDMFLVRSSLGQDIIQSSPQTLKGKMVVRKGVDVEAVHFRSRGKVTFNIFTPWIDPSDHLTQTSYVTVGIQPRRPIDGKSITLDPFDPSVQSDVNLTEKGVAIEYDPVEGVWKLRSSLPEINFIANSTKPVDQIKTIGFKPSKADKTDYLLIKSTDGFKPSASSGFSDRSTACTSVVAGDFDNDMDIDLYLVCTGHIQNMPNILYENDGMGHFIEIPNAGGAAGSEMGSGNQVVSADYDRDGFLDLFVTNGAGQPPFSYEGPHQLFRNKGNTNHWLEIDLQGTISNRDGIGSEIELEAGGIIQKRCQDGGMHSFSQNHQRIHFGLGRNTKVNRITIRWPSGEIQELSDISADQILQIIEPAHSQ